MRKFNPYIFERVPRPGLLDIFDRKTNRPRLVGETLISNEGAVKRDTLSPTSGRKRGTHMTPPFKVYNDWLHTQRHSQAAFDMRAVYAFEKSIRRFDVYL